MMNLNVSKDQLIKMLVDKTLFNFLMKKNFIRKGDLICYGKMLDINVEDLCAYFEKNGYPGLNKPRHEVKTKPEGGEGDTIWTKEDSVYTVWFIERNIPEPEFSTESKEAFESW